MSRFVIHGGLPLHGLHAVPGNKNAALPMLAASTLADGPVVLEGIPLIRDVNVMLGLLESIGMAVDLDEAEHRVSLDPSGLRVKPLDPRLCHRVRTSILFAGPLGARFGSAEIASPGGDAIGQRRLDTHFDGFSALGLEVDVGDPYRFRRRGARLRGADIVLDEASVTATENILMAAVLAEGTTTIYNAACEPHVANLAEMLRSMGADIQGDGTNRIVVRGVETLHGTTAKVWPDAIEAASFIAAAAATGGSVELDAVPPADMRVIARSFARLGFQWEMRPDSSLWLPVRQARRVVDGYGHAIPKIEDGIWPSTPSDVMSALIVLATQTEGTVLFFEKLFESRMYFVDHLIGMGARIVQCDPHRIVVQGPAPLHGTHVSSPDIRAGMALIIAALCAKGETFIHNAESIDRGYEAIDASLRALGADIVREKDSQE